MTEIKRLYWDMVSLWGVVDVNRYFLDIGNRVAIYTPVDNYVVIDLSNIKSLMYGVNLLFLKLMFKFWYSKEKIHCLFFTHTFTAVLWNLFDAIAFSSETERELWLFFRLVAGFEIILVLMILHFIMDITKPKKVKY